MATIRLVPSTYSLQSSSYFTVSNAQNCYTDTDSTTYATFQTSSSSTSSRYFYLKGFNFDDIPSAAVVSSFTVKIKGYESGASTSSSYAPALCHDTTTISNTTASSNFSTSVKTITIPTGSLEWEDIIGYGDNFAIRVNGRRSSRNTASYIYVYGAEIEVEYTVPNPRTITTTLTGDGTISPSGETTTYDGEEFELTITPTNASDTVMATRDGIDITSELVAHGSETSTSTVLGEYTLVSGSFNGSGATYFAGIVGNGYDATETTSNYYSGGSSTIAVFTYDVGITLPSNANITRVYALVNGHAESTSNSSEYMCAQLISGSTELSEELNFKDIGTSNTTQTLECETLPTVTQLAEMKLQCRVGYYGGAINGATVYVEYDIGGSSVDHYTYTFIVSSSTTIAVTISGSTETSTLYVKLNGTWITVEKAYIKQNGTWVQQADLTTVFDSTTHYIKGN